jgi:hypothetical protein
MADFTVRSDAVDVEQIMRQIRARIKEKRGVDYTEAELHELASVKLEKFLDPRGLRSDLVAAFRKHRVVSPEPPKYEFEDTTLYDTHRGALRTIRRLLHPFLKLLFNPNPLIHALHTQKQVNDEFHRRFRAREEMDPLYYEVIHNLVVELTRLGIEVHNLKMRVESLSSRLDFDERRTRAFESVVEYRQRRPASANAAGGGGSAAAVADPSGAAAAPVAGSPAAGAATTVPGVTSAPATPQGPPAGGPAPGGAGGFGGGSGERRRRRRRRRRRPGSTMGDRGPGGATGAPGGAFGPGGAPGEAAGPADAMDHDDDGGLDDGPGGAGAAEDGEGDAQ